MLTQVAVAVAVAAARLLEQLTAELGLALQQPGTCQPGKQRRGRPSRMEVRSSRGAQVRKRTEGERVGGVGTEAGEVGQAKLSSRTVS